ncbi:MAG: DUF2619 domain-containing protein [Clostridiales bacterium]|jgi:hypothetical protein|nr:DUF2619 domain-containing protein [Clostridiales bacterium]
MDARVKLMGLTRVIYGLLGLTGGLLIFYFNDLQQAILINGILGSIGPFVFLSVSALGIAALRAKMDKRKLLLLILGVTLIMLGIR